MNERIKQLWDDAALASGDESQTWDGQVAFMALFAELIVRECIDIAYNEGDNVAYLALHFGVEE